MSDRSITFDQWTRCEEAIAALNGGLGILLNIWDAAAHGHNFERKATASGLYFLMQSMDRQIVTLKRQLGFRIEVDDADEDGSEPGRSTSQGTSPSPELLAWRNARAIYWAVSDKNQETSAAWIRNHRDEFNDDGDMVDAMHAVPECRALSEAFDAAEKALDASVEAMMAKPIRCWSDVAELAEMVRGEMRWKPGERHEDDDNAADPKVAALFDAIASMASKGGANV